MALHLRSISVIRVPSGMAKIMIMNMIFRIVWTSGIERISSSGFIYVLCLAAKGSQVVEDLKVCLSGRSHHAVDR